MALYKYVKTFFSHVDVLIMTILCFIGIVMTIPHIGNFTILLALISGLILYMIGEYTTHRFLFHMKPPKNRILLKAIKRLHYDHHEYPNELRLLFLPLWYTLPQFVVIGIIIFLIFNSLPIVIAFLTGAIAMLLYYEWTHYVAHRPITPITPWGKWMKKYHLLHHFRNEHYWYGVTSPSLDVLCGTYKNEKEVEKSETARKLNINV